jgi:hypothetical protein
VLDVSAKIPAVRVQPADGPELSEDAQLVLDPDHALIARLAPALTASLSAVTGVRLLVSASLDGAELAGTLHGGTTDDPGDALPKAVLGRVAVAASASPGWVDLALAAPHQLAGGEVIWLELQVTRGSLVWRLAALSSSADSDAKLRRRTSNGRYVSLTPFGGVSDYAAALRVVGKEKPNDPLAAVRFAVAGGSDTVAGVPTQSGTTLMLGLTAPGIAPSPAAGGVGFEVPLDLTISTPGSYAVRSAELQYTQP